jgi:hypothetical protein
VKSLSRYDDLSEEDKIKVIAGFVLVGAFIAGLIAFNAFVLNSSQIATIWESNTTFFSTIRSILFGFFVMIVLPSIIAVSITIAVLKRRLSGLATGLPALLAVGAALLLSYVLLTLFDVFFATLPLEMQAILMLLAFFVPAIILALIMKTEKVNSYLRKRIG